MLQPSRREFIRLSSLVLPSAAVYKQAEPDDAPRVAAGFPTQAPEVVQEMVVVAHGNVARVKALLSRQPTLAKATWDWGFGDWETALGAASHVGSREIAGLLLENGAHPTIFSAAMLGHLDVVKAFIAASPGIQRTRGPHSISLMKHALAGGSPAQSVVDYLKTLPDADDHVATEPLSEDELVRLSGVYVFGMTPADRLEVSATGRQLQIGRPGHFPRPLLHRGAFEFSPLGAESVRVVFKESPSETLLTIHDPDIVLTARHAGRRE